MKVKSTLLLFLCLLCVSTIHGQRKGATAFKVSDVEQAKRPLLDTSSQVVMEYLLTKKLLLFPESEKNQRIIPTYNHSFIDAIQWSFAEHRPLVLSPDEAWMLLAQGFSIHMNKNFKSLSDKAFKKDRPENLIVQMDALVEKNSDDWSQLISAFSSKVQQYAEPGYYNMLVPTFSTTSETVHTAFEINLMESAKQAFGFMAESGCGIPEITLMGNVSDWKEIRKKVELFRAYGLDEWVTTLEPILDQFINAKLGKVDIPFWEAIYKEASVYGATFINGWVIDFFPYIERYSYDGLTEEEYTPVLSYEVNPFLGEGEYLISNLTTSDFPKGISSVPIKWIIHQPNGEDLEKDIVAYAGFFGIKQDFVTLGLEPYICSGIAETHQEEYYTDLYLDHDWEDLNHSGEEYYPFIDSLPKIKAIYHPEINQSYESGIDELKNYLLDQLSTHGNSMQVESIHLNFSFIVTFTGTVTQVNALDTKTAESPIFKELNSLLLNLPHHWKPPITGDTFLQEFMIEPDPIGTGEQTIVRANQKINLSITIR